jgi:lambda family phage minor tail protein L
MTTTPDAVERELYSLEPSAIIELFELHLTLAVNGVDLVYYFHAGTNELSANPATMPADKTNIVFGGVAYPAVPIEVEGFAVTAKGTLPRPTMTIANANTAISALLGAYNPLQAEVRRIRTCKKFLDAVNFASGSNPTADPTAIFNGGYESWYIDRVAAENPQLVQFELIGKLDLTNLRLPGRQVVEHCQWEYKGAECRYKPGKMFDLQNREVTDASQDQCNKTIKACKLRYPKGEGIGTTKNLLPFGGFPGARLQA